MTTRRSMVRHLLAALAIATVSAFGLAAPSSADLAACVTTETVDGDYTVVQFLTVGDCLWTVPAGVSSVEYLVVAAGGGGGGGGGRNYSCAPTGTPAGLPRTGGGGAGGAGGAVTFGNASVTAGSEIAVSVGAGGAGGAGGTCPIGSSATGGSDGDGGGASVFGEVSAAGGTGGDGAPDTGAGGASGGTTNGDVVYQGGTQDLAASDCPINAVTGCFAAPGGAGAGGNGGNPVLPDGQADAIYTNGGAGGAGIEWRGTFYGGGGGGGNRHCSSNPFAPGRSGGAGGNGGGGDGALIACPAGTGAGTDGVDNFGGGGGGGRGNGATAANMNNAGAGGAGGDGQVVVRYSNAPTVSDLTVSDVTRAAAKMSWQSLDPNRYTGFKVRINGVVTQTLAGNATEFAVTGLKGNTQYLIELVPFTDEGDAEALATTIHSRRVIRVSVLFRGGRYKLLPFASARLQHAASAIETGATDVRVTIIGKVKKVGNRVSKGDHALAAARAQVVKSRLWKFGVKGTWSLLANPYAATGVDDSRRTDIIITYQPPLHQG